MMKQICIECTLSGDGKTCKHVRQPRKKQYKTPFMRPMINRFYYWGDWEARWYTSRGMDPPRYRQHWNFPPERACCYQYKPERAPKN